MRFQQWRECRRGQEVGGVHLGSRSLRTYLQQKGQGYWWWRWGFVWGEVHLHRSTGLRSWTAKDRRSGARGVSLLHPQLSLRECSSPHHSLSRKRKRERKATQCTHSNWKVERPSLETAPSKGKTCHVTSHSGDECVKSKLTMGRDQFEGEMKTQVLTDHDSTNLSWAV